MCQSDRPPSEGTTALTADQCDQSCKTQPPLLKNTESADFVEPSMDNDGLASGLLYNEVREQPFCYNYLLALIPYCRCTRKFFNLIRKSL